MNNEFSSLRISEKSENILKSYILCCKSIRNVYKSAKNTHQNYKYATLEDVIDSIKEELSSNDLAVMISVCAPNRLETRTSKSGVCNYNIEVKVIIRLFHISGEWIEIDCYGEGQDSGDKAIYKAITGAKKYGIQNLFGIATTDDPEKDEPSKAIKNEKIETKSSSSFLIMQLITAFSKIGVYDADILNRYSIHDFSELGDKEIEELRIIFKLIKDGENKNEYFK